MLRQRSIFIEFVWKNLGLMLAAHLVFHMLPAACLMWLLFAVMPDLRLFSAFYRQNLMFGLWWPSRRSSQYFKEGWDVMWVHVTMMGGCGRAVCPSYCTKQQPVKILLCTPFVLSNTQSLQMLGIMTQAWLGHALLTRSNLLTTKKKSLHDRMYDILLKTSIT